MKKRLVGTIVVLLSIVSCKKDFIQLNPISATNVEAVYKSDKDFQDAIVGVYAVLKDQYQNFWQFGDLRADDSWHALGNDASLIAVDKFSLNSSAGILISSWRNYYDVINRANLILDKIEKVNSTTVTNKEQYVGEAKFLRAFAYFDLVRIFGDVPLVTTPISIDEGYKTGRESEENIYIE